jgi:hypothetical protein
MDRGKGGGRWRRRVSLASVLVLTIAIKKNSVCLAGGVVGVEVRHA